MNHQKYLCRIAAGCLALSLSFACVACHNRKDAEDVETSGTEEKGQDMERASQASTVTAEADREIQDKDTKDLSEEVTTEAVEESIPEDRTISWDSDWEYAEFSKIHDSDVNLYYSHVENRKEKVVAVNAGHGTEGGSSVKTQCHPDGSAKVTGGTTSSGATEAYAVSSGMEFLDGTEERDATLSAALLLKEKLLENGYDVLMIRETEDTQLDNIARTVYANEFADCHIALHYDSTENDKGAFYMSVPDVDSYRSMEPVASHWQEDNALGDALIWGLEEEGVSIFGDGSMEADLTQTSYSTIASVDLEIGDAASSYDEDTQSRICDGILEGLDRLWE